MSHSCGRIPAIEIDETADRTDWDRYDGRRGYIGAPGIEQAAVPRRHVMQTDNKFFDDMAKAASGALGSFAGLRHEIEIRVQQQLERLLGRMNLVSREEFEAMKAVAQAAREEQIKLERRLADLEAKLGAGTPPEQQS